MRLIYSYAACRMPERGNEGVGGIVGLHPGASRIQFAAFDAQINDDALFSDDGLAWKLQTSYMQQSSTMSESGWNFTNTYNSLNAFCANTNYTGIWTIVENITYPLFPYEGRYCSYITAFQDRLSNNLITLSSLSNTKSSLTGKSYIEVEKEQYNLLEENSIGVYPNPTKDKIRIAGQINTEIKVFDTTGKMILSTDNVDVDLSIYPSGIYLVKVNGKTFKILKNK